MTSAFEVRGFASVVHALAVGVLAIVLGSWTTAARAQCDGRWLDSPDRYSHLSLDVTDLAASPNGNVVAASRNIIARWDGNSWTHVATRVLREPGSTEPGQISALANLPNGNIVAAGRFGSIEGVSVNNIAQWDGSSWSPLGSGLDTLDSVDEVLALAVLPNGDLVAGGIFATSGGTAVNNIARWDGSNWVSMGIESVVLDLDGIIVYQVSACAVLPNGTLVAGVEVAFANDPSRPIGGTLVRWDGVSWSSVPFRAGDSPLYPLSLSRINALTALPDGDLIVSGDFRLFTMPDHTAPDGLAFAAGIVRWDGDSFHSMGNVSFDYNDGSINDAAVLPNGDIVAVGSFRKIGGVEATNIARWDGRSWGPMGCFGLRGSFPYLYKLSALAVTHDGDLFLGGVFDYSCSDQGTNSVDGVARWDGTSWQPTSERLDGLPLAFAVLPNGDLVAGGTFKRDGGVRLNRIGRWNGTSWGPLGLGMNERVVALAVLPNGDLVAGGGFSTAGGKPIRGIARWDGTDWYPLGSGLSDGSVYALLVLPNGDLIAGGSFTTAGGVTVNNIARWNGISWAPLGNGINGEVRALALLPNGDLVAGSKVLPSIARWNGSTWSPFESSPDDAVYALAVSNNGDLIAGGRFRTAGGVVVNGIARWNGRSWEPFGDGIETLGQHSGYPYVFDLAVLPNGDVVMLYGSDSFQVYDRVNTVGRAWQDVARWNGTTWTRFAPPGGLTALNQVHGGLSVLPNGDLVAGGESIWEEGSQTYGVNWARWSNTGVPTVARKPVGQSVDPGQSVTLSAVCASGYDFDGPVAFQWHRDGVPIRDGPGGASPGGGTVSGATGNLSSTSLGTTLTIDHTQPTDAGKYTVVFTNSCGSVESQPVKVCYNRLPNGCDPGSRLRPTLAPDGALTANYVSEDGRLFVYSYNPTQEAWFQHEIDELGITSQVNVPFVPFHDAHTGLSFAALSSSDGTTLVLTEFGERFVRNLTDELPGATAIESTPVALQTIDQLTLFGGFDSNGDFVVYWQTGLLDADGNEIWNYSNLYRDHVRPQGITPPTIVGEMVSFVTDWNALTFAGLDESGNVWTIWWAPGLPLWTMSNLSEATGAGPIADGLTAFVTPWNGIKIAGLSPEGEVVVTWWVPDADATWRTSNLSSMINHPGLRPGELAAYVSPWGGLNLAGLDQDGHLAVYWWAPGMSEWVVSPLSSLIPNAPIPARAVSGLAAPSGMMSIFAYSTQNSPVRYWWEPGGQWRAEDLSEVATPR